MKTKTRLAMNLCPCPVCSTETQGYFPSVKMSVRIVNEGSEVFLGVAKGELRDPDAVQAAINWMFDEARGRTEIFWEMNAIVECKHLEARSDLNASIDDDRDFFHPMKISYDLRYRLAPEAYLSKRFPEIEEEWISDALRGDRHKAGSGGVWKTWESKCREYRKAKA